MKLAGFTVRIDQKGNHGSGTTRLNEDFEDL